MDRTSWRRRLGYEQRYVAFLRDCCGYEVAPVEERVITGKAPGSAKDTKPKAKPKAKAEPKTPEEVAAEQAEWSAGYDKQGGEGSPAPVVESSAGAYIDPDDELDDGGFDPSQPDVDDEDDDEFGERVMSRPVEDVDLPDGDVAVPV
jgi:hypothetical protein